MYCGYDMSGDKRASCSEMAILSIFARAAVGLEWELPDSNGLFAGL